MNDLHSRSVPNENIHPLVSFAPTIVSVTAHQGNASAISVLPSHIQVSIPPRERRLPAFLDRRHLQCDACEPEEAAEEVELDPGQLITRPCRPS
jgi:hypothetical protein